MKKEFVYFFKHNNVNGIKIGKASGESVLERFMSFKTYAPFGASIVGFFETDNGFRDEKELHQRFKDFRLQGEFFDISIDLVNNIIFEKNKDYHKSLILFNEWIANPENDTIKLISLFKKSNDKFIDNGIISKDILTYFQNNNFELNRWYNFNDQFELFKSNYNFSNVSVVSYTKNLKYYCMHFGFKLEKIRKRSDNNRHYFKILDFENFGKLSQ